MKGRPSDDRALDFRAHITDIGPTPCALHTRTDSFFGKLYIRECAHTVDPPSACVTQKDFFFFATGTATTLSYRL